MQINKLLKLKCRGRGMVIMARCSYSSFLRADSSLHGSTCVRAAVGKASRQKRERRRSDDLSQSSIHFLPWMANVWWRIGIPGTKQMPPMTNCFSTSDNTLKGNYLIKEIRLVRFSAISQRNRKDLHQGTKQRLGYLQTSAPTDLPLGEVNLHTC